MAEAPAKTIRMGMVGIGVGGAEILPAMDSTPGIELYADADLDAVWVSTPNRFHAPHTIYALEHGKHVVVEKPMALSIGEAAAMNEAAAKSNRILTAGHTDSYSFHIRAMRRIINS